MKKKQRALYSIASSAALAAFVVYLAALKNGFVEWDDNFYVFENRHIQAMNGSFFRWAFFDFYEANWHPLTWISHAVDYSLWGLNPFGHHLTSVVLHAINSFLVVLLIARLLDIAKERGPAGSAHMFPTGRSMLIIAGTTGLLFGVHPVHVESAAWVAERKDVLCALFFLLSIMMYAKAAWGMEHGAEGKKSRASTPCSVHHAAFADKYYLSALGFFILALLSKPMAVTLPVVLLILDWHPFDRIRSWETLRRAAAEKVPFFALSAASAAVTILAQQAGDAIQSSEFSPLSIRTMVALRSVVVYLSKMIWPRDLVPYYPYPTQISLVSFRYLVPIVLFAVTTSCFLIIAKKRKVWAAAWGYYCVTLIPVLGIIQVGRQAMADRYAYLPSLGPFFLIGLTAAYVYGKIMQIRKGRLLARIAALALAGLAVTALSLITQKQIGVWKDGIQLWTYIIDNQQEKIAFAYNNRGLAFDHAGQPVRAISDYDAAISVDPSHFRAYYNRGSDFYKTGEIEKAITDYERAIALRPSYYEAYSNRGAAYYMAGRIDKAIADFDQAIALEPSYYPAYYNRALAFEKAGRPDRAAQDFAEADALQRISYR